MKSAFWHRFMITDGWEGVSSQQRHLQGIRKRRQEARPATWRRLRRSSCKNMKAGAIAHGAEAAKKHEGPRHGGAVVEVLEVRGGRLSGGRHPPGGENDSGSQAEGCPGSPARPRKTPRPKQATTRPPPASGAA
jgi:hypothetical protein